MKHGFTRSRRNDDIDGVVALFRFRIPVSKQMDHARIQGDQYSFTLLGVHHGGTATIELELDIASTVVSSFQIVLCIHA